MAQQTFKNDLFNKLTNLFSSVDENDHKLGIEFLKGQCKPEDKEDLRLLTTMIYDNDSFPTNVMSLYLDYIFETFPEEEALYYVENTFENETAATK